MRGQRCIRNKNLCDDFIILQNVLSANVSLRRQSEKLVEWNHLPAVSTNNGHACTERDKHRGEIRRVNDERRTAAENRVVLVFPGLGVTLVSTLLQALNFFESKVPTTRTLAEIACDSSKISNLRRGY